MIFFIFVLPAIDASVPMVMAFVKQKEQ
jgi:hypothetical protein